MLFLIITFYYMLCLNCALLDIMFLSLSLPDLDLLNIIYLIDLAFLILLDTLFFYLTLFWDGFVGVGICRSPWHSGSHLHLGPAVHAALDDESGWRFLSGSPLPPPWQIPSSTWLLNHETGANSLHVLILYMYLCLVCVCVHCVKKKGTFRQLQITSRKYYKV